MRHFLTSALLALFIIIGGGCATNYKMRVDALSTGEVSGYNSGLTYVLASGDDGVKENDLFFKKVAEHVNPALEEKGYKLAGDAADADLLIEVKAYLSEPMVETEIYAEPVYVFSGGLMRSYRVPVVNEKGKVVRYYYADYWEPSRMVYGGWIDHSRQVTVFDKVLRLSARRIISPTELGDELWTTVVSFRNKSTDYRATLPYLILAIGPYIGEQTSEQKIIVIQKDAAEVEAYKAGFDDG